MPDWKEAKETRERDIPQTSAGRPETMVGLKSMQGPPEDDKPSDDASDLATVHSSKGPEFLDNEETEGHTVSTTVGEDSEGKQEGKEGSLKPPPGWHPGGAERGG